MGEAFERRERFFSVPGAHEYALRALGPVGDLGASGVASALDASAVPMVTVQSPSGDPSVTWQHRLRALDPLRAFLPRAWLPAISLS